jgi:hypothetical protein
MKNFALVLVLMVISMKGYAEEVEVPLWVLKGILKTETRSYYEAGAIVYVDQRIGSAGEIGPFQMKRIAFDTVALKGEDFNKLTTDMVFSEEIAKRYLIWIYNNSGKGSWERTVAIYNVGQKNYVKKKKKWLAYLSSVKKYGNA